MDWTRGHTIGRGSSATVYLATSRHSDDIFAVKSVELSQSESLQREQKILSSLSCPHIVSYKGCNITTENNNLMYNLLMEYVAGGTLTEAIHKQGGRLEESTIGYYTCQIVRGLEYLHSNGLVHCDIKGRNVLIGESGAKIGDLGFARWINLEAKTRFQEEVAAAPIAGTLVFMAPEVARGENQGFPSDVWALGCTMIEMATGCSPWPDVTDPISALYRIGFSKESPNFPSFLSKQAKDFLSKCLMRDPKERWTASQLLQHPFLGEFNSNTKQLQESNSHSPTSTLDQGLWNSLEESETLGNLIPTSSSNSPAQRIARLSLFSGVPSWTWDENWITIRSNHNEGGEVSIDNIEAEADASCGSITASISHSMEELERPVISDYLFCFLDSDVNISSSSSNSMNLLMACSCIKDSVVMSNLNFERHKSNLLLIQS